MRLYVTEDNGEHKDIGSIEGKAYIKMVKKSKHHYKKLDAWGIDAEVFNTTISKMCDKIVVLDTEEVCRYEVEVKVFDGNSMYLHFKPHRSQRFLPLRFWKMTRGLGIPSEEKIEEEPAKRRGTEYIQDMLKLLSSK